jgi:hypothetical protein
MYQRRRKLQENEENCMTRGFIICAFTTQLVIRVRGLGWAGHMPISCMEKEAMEGTDQEP